MASDDRGDLSRLIIALIIIADAVLAIDFATAVAIPLIGEKLGAVPGVIQWIISGYSLAFGSFALLGGRVSDVAGDGRCYVIGCLLSAFAMLLSAAASSVPLLIAARALAGIAAAFLLPATLSLLANYFPPGPRQLRVLSIHVAASAIANPLGGLLIGFLIERIGWWTAFVTMCPAIVAAGLLAWRYIPARSRIAAGSRNEQTVAPLNPGLALLFAALIAGLTWSLSNALTVETIGRGTAIAILASCIGLLAVLTLRQWRRPFPLIPVELFTSRSYLLALSLSGIMTAAVTTNMLLIHLTLQRVAGFSPSQSGLMFVPSGAFALFLGIVVAPRIAPRILLHPRASMALFFATVAVAAIIMSMPFEKAYVVTIFLPAMFLMNIGIVFGSSAVMAQIYRSAPPGTQGVTSSLIFTFRMLFIASGTSAIVTFASQHRVSWLSVVPLNAYGTGFLLSALAVLLGIALISILRPAPQA